jgi:hypothetical protein
MARNGVAAIDQLLGLSEEEGNYLAQLIGHRKVNPATPDQPPEPQADITGAVNPRMVGNSPATGATDNEMAGPVGIRPRYAGGPTVSPNYPSTVPQAPTPPVYQPPPKLPWWKNVAAVGLGALSGLSGPQAPALVAHNVYGAPEERAKEQFGRDERQYERQLSDRERQQQLEESGRHQRMSEARETARDEDTARYRSGELALGTSREGREREMGTLREKRLGEFEQGQLTYHGREASAAERRAAAAEATSKAEVEQMIPARAEQARSTAEWNRRRKDTSARGTSLTEYQKAQIRQKATAQKSAIRKRYSSRGWDPDAEQLTQMNSEIADVDDQMNEALSGSGGEDREAPAPKGRRYSPGSNPAGLNLPR